MELATLFSATRQMSVIALSAAIGQGLPYRTVPEVNVMFGDGRREKSTRLFFLEVKPHRSIACPRRVPDPILVAAYGVSEAAPAAEAAPELPLLRERFEVRPSLTMGELAQRAGPAKLVIGRDYMQCWPRQVNRSRTAGDNLYLMKALFHPGQLLYGEADREAVETMKKEIIRKRLSREGGESAGPSTSSSRWSRERAPAASSPGKRRRISSSHSRDGGREKSGVRSPSPRPTSLATSSAQQPAASTPSRQDESDKSLGKGKDESRAKKAPAKKSRVHKLSSSSSENSSSSSSSSDSSSSDSSSSSEDEAIAEDKVLDRSEEEQLRVLKKKETARKKEKREKRRKKEKEKKSVLKWAKVLSVYLRETPETRKEAEKSEAEQQEKEAETPKADLTETGRGGAQRRAEREREGQEAGGEVPTIKDRLGSLSHRRLERPARRRAVPIS